MLLLLFLLLTDDVVVVYRYMRVEVPVHIVQRDTLGKACLESLVELPKILTQEEQEAYSRTARSELDLVSRIHNSSGELVIPSK